MIQTETCERISMQWRCKESQKEHKKLTKLVEYDNPR